MKTTKLNVLLLVLLFVSTHLLAQSNSKAEQVLIKMEDIQKFPGQWKGTLTYMDYSTNKPFSMPCEMDIFSKRKNRQLRFFYRYPNEPKANSKGKIKISKDRTKIDSRPIVSRTTNADGNVEIITEYSGKDGNDNKNATIRNFYIIGSKKLIIKKEVQFEGTKEWILRNEYNFDR